MKSRTWTKCFNRYGVKHGYIDYVAAWLVRAIEYAQNTETRIAFVTTNSICQGHQVPLLWPIIFASGHEIEFAHTSFKWANLAAHNAGVTVVIVGLTKQARSVKKLFSETGDEGFEARSVSSINAYLVAGANLLVGKSSKPINGLDKMDLGNMPYDGGNLLLSRSEAIDLNLSGERQRKICPKNFWFERIHFKPRPILPLD